MGQRMIFTCGMKLSFINDVTIVLLPTPSDRHRSDKLKQEDKKELTVAHKDHANISH